MQTQCTIVQYFHYLLHNLFHSETRQGEDREGECNHGRVELPRILEFPPLVLPPGLPGGCQKELQKVWKLHGPKQWTGTQPHTFTQTA